MVRGRDGLVGLVLLALMACESREDQQRRSNAEAEARVYADEAERMSDRGARTTESADAKKLVNLREARATALDDIERRTHYLATLDAGRPSKATVDEQTHLLASDRKRLARAEEELVTQQQLVEGSRDKLVALKGATEKALANPRGDAGPSRDVLRQRLEGIEASLAETRAALAGGRDGG